MTRIRTWLAARIYPGDRAHIEMGHQASSGSYSDRAKLRCDRCGTPISDWTKKACLVHSGRLVVPKSFRVYVRSH